MFGVCIQVWPQMIQIQIRSCVGAGLLFSALGFGCRYVCGGATIGRKDKSLLGVFIYATVPEFGFMD